MWLFVEPARTCAVALPELASEQNSVVRIRQRERIRAAIGGTRRGGACWCVLVIAGLGTIYTYFGIWCGLLSSALNAVRSNGLIFASRDGLVAMLLK